MERRNSETLRERRRKRVFEIVEIGAADDALSRGYDFFGSFVVVLALAASVAATFDGAEARCGALLDTVEIVTSAFFAVDYALRVWTARCLYPTLTPGKAVLRYVTSVGGLIDLVSFLPTFLPVFFPSGMVAFRMFRVVRIFRLFRINAYYDSLHVITEVLRSKRQQLLSSVFIILTLMLASSLCMYSLEHEAQPEGFRSDQHIDLKEITLRRQNPWVGQHIRELDISRRTLIVLVRRDGKSLIPHGDLRLREGDTVVLYTQTAVRPEPETEEIIEF